MHNPPFGEDFADNFVDPLTIGTPGGPEPHPYLPLLQGSTWVYEGTFMEDGEEITEVITVTVTDKIKLIDGIRCLVVRDTVEVDGELIEDTDDWFAQDVDGNLWYCGEEVKDYETFDGDLPPIPELVAIDGSFKAGRDGDEAGILLPAVPVAGDIYRQEVSFRQCRGRDRDRRGRRNGNCAGRFVYRRLPGYAGLFAAGSRGRGEQVLRARRRHDSRG